MESALFVPTTAGNDWLNEVLPGWSAAALPIAGRRFIDYMLEVARRFDIVFAEVLDWHYSNVLYREYSDLARTGCAVFYMKGEGAMPHGLDDLSDYPSPLTLNMPERLAVVWGLALPFHMPNVSRLEPISTEESAVTPPGVYRRVSGRWMRVVPHSTVVSNVRSWHTLNMAVLNDPGGFMLPGYSAESGVHLGRNVVMERGTMARAPVILNDNTWMARNVQLRGNVIIGSGSFIDEGARLANTVVGPNTFIGKGLELNGKIVIGRRVMDAETGEWTDVDESGIAQSIGGEYGLLRSIWHFLRGHSYGRHG